MNAWADACAAAPVARARSGELSRRAAAMKTTAAIRAWRFSQAKAEAALCFDKLAAETALVNEQLLQVKRENAAASAAAQTLSGRSWFIPSPVHAIQYRLRNSALPNRWWW